MRYGHAMTAYTGIAHWLNENGYTPNTDNWQKQCNYYRQTMLDFMQAEGMKVVTIKTYKGKKVNISLMVPNANAYKIQKVFTRFTQWVAANQVKND